MELYSEMSSREKEAVLELRNSVSDILPEFKRKSEQHDLWLLRYIRARELNLNKAESMLRNHLKWRQENHVNEILEKNIPPHFYQEFPVIICGKDKEGFPVGAIQVGKWDFRAMLESGLKDEFIVLVVKFFEIATNIFDAMSTGNTFIFQACMIADLENFEYKLLISKEFISMLLELVKIFEAHYPEILRCLWVINAPAVFNVLWTAVKPFLTERTRSKIRIFGSNKKKWREDILTMIDHDNLPSIYGGSNTCLLDFDVHSNWDIKKLSENYKVLPKENMKKVYISPGQCHAVTVEAKYGEEIHWNFETEKNDIIFRVDFEGEEDIVGPWRVDSDFCIQKGAISVGKCGIYTLVFDNTHSLYTGKNLRYIVSTTSKPDEIFYKFY